MNLFWVADSWDFYELFIVIDFVGIRWYVFIRKQMKKTQKPGNIQLKITRDPYTFDGQASDIMHGNFLLLF